MSVKLSADEVEQRKIEAGQWSAVTEKPMEEMSLGELLYRVLVEAQAGQQITPVSA